MTALPPGPAYASALLPSPIVTADNKPLLVVFEAAAIGAWQGAAAKASSLIVTDAESLKTADATLVQLHSMAKAIEARRVELKKPLTDLGKAIESVVAQIAEPLSEAKRSLLGKISAFNRIQAEAEDKARQERLVAQARAEAERARLQAIEDDKHRKALADAKMRAEAEAAELEAMLGSPVKAEPVAVAAALVVKAEPVAAVPIPVAVKSEAIQTRTVRKLEIFNADDVPIKIGGQLIRPINESAVKEMLAAGIDVLGCRMIEVTETVMRGTR